MHCGLRRFHIQGMLSLAVQATIPSLKPAPGETASVGQLAVMFSALYIIALGTGGIKPNVAAFGADQFDEKNPKVLVRRVRQEELFHVVLLHSELWLPDRHHRHRLSAGDLELVSKLRHHGCLPHRGRDLLCGRLAAVQVGSCSRPRCTCMQLICSTMAQSYMLQEAIDRSNTECQTL
eukprot:scaffold46768_cov46-Prasinocladus_malaysianus.AAC.1